MRSDSIHASRNVCPRSRASKVEVVALATVGGSLAIQMIHEWSKVVASSLVGSLLDQVIGPGTDHGSGAAGELERSRRKWFLSMASEQPQCPLR